MSALILIISVCPAVCIAVVPEMLARTETRTEVWLEGSKGHINLYRFLVLFPGKGYHEDDAFDSCR